MRKPWFVVLVLLAGCSTMPQEPTTQQVSPQPFTEPRSAAPIAKASYAPAPVSQETSYRVLLIKDRLVGENPTVALKPAICAVGSPDPEIFHVGMNQIYITERLVRQCQTDGQLAAVIAFELGRMIAEREAAISDEVRSPERLLPMHLPIGGGTSARDTDPMHAIEMAQYEKQYPKTPRKLTRPNPHLIARDALEKAGYQRTDFDAALPILANAERYHVLESQMKGTVKQGDWKAP
jgi:hypothetical protein